jgi:S1-C subfamily serine protease
MPTSQAELDAILRVCENPTHYQPYEASRGWRRVAWFNSVMLWVALLVIAIATTCGCCQQSASALTLGPSSVDTLLVPGFNQVERGARLLVECADGPPGSDSMQFRTLYGSSVVLDGHHLLTASHVVPCQEGMIIGVKLPNGLTVQAQRVRADREHDIALLWTHEDMGNFKRPEVAYAAPGEIVCMQPAYPEGARRSCGYVKGMTKKGAEGNAFGEVAWPDIETTLTTIPGNSGAGLWNAGGALVGVITHESGTATSARGAGMLP